MSIDVERQREAKCRTFSHAVYDPVTRIPAPVGDVPGAIAVDYVDGVAGVVPHLAPLRVPRGAPVIVRGWASFANVGTPSAVRILLDRANVYDVHTADRSDDGKIRFVAVIPTNDVGAGGHEVRATILVGDERWFEAAAAAFTVDEPRLARIALAARSARLHVESVVDAPPDGTRQVAVGAVPLGDHAIVTGWALDAATLAPAAGVVITVRGRRYAGSCDLPRPDVRAVLGGSASDRMGFEAFVPTGDLGVGEHVARVDCYDAAGRVGASDDVVISVASRQRPFPAFASCTPEPPACEATIRVRARRAGDGDDAERPQRMHAATRTWHATRDDTLEISGWANDPWGKPASGVYLELLRADDVAEITPHRMGGIAGYTDADRKRAGSFRLVVPLRHERDGAFELALLALGPDRRVYGRANLGSLIIAGRVVPH